MANLIKMDMRRLFHSKVFYITMGIVAFLNIVILAAVPMVSKLLMPQAEAGVTNLSSIIAGPFSIGWMIIAVFISMVSFSYADMANGYIKNIAGQISRRSDSVFSKLVVIGIHNLEFFVVASLSMLLGNLIGCGLGGGQIVADSQVFGGILTLLLKWLLSMAVCSILLFFTTGVKNKTLATIIGVVLGTGTMGLVYGGINAAVSGIFKVEGFDLSMYMPDSLLSSVNVTDNTGVINAVIVSAAFIAVFTALTVKVFNTKDIK